MWVSGTSCSMKAFYGRVYLWYCKEHRGERERHSVDPFRVESLHYKLQYIYCALYIYTYILQHGWGALACRRFFIEDHVYQWKNYRYIKFIHLSNRAIKEQIIDEVFDIYLTENNFLLRGKSARVHQPNACSVAFYTVRLHLMVVIHNLLT